MAPNFRDSKIYRIVNDQIPGTAYYGSTTQALSARWSRHKYCARHPSEGTASRQLFMIGTPKIELIEHFPCDTKKELWTRERFYIENNNCVNYAIPGRTQKEYNHQYRDKMAQYSKQYRIDNHAAILIWKKTKTKCDCGKKVMNVGVARHKRTNYHIKNSKQIGADGVI